MTIVWDKADEARACISEYTAERTLVRQWVKDARESERHYLGMARHYDTDHDTYYAGQAEEWALHMVALREVLARVNRHLTNARRRLARATTNEGGK